MIHTLSYSSSAVVTRIVQVLKKNQYRVTSQGKSKVKAHREIFCNNTVLGTNYIKVRVQQKGDFKVREVKPQSGKIGMHVTERTFHSEDDFNSHITLK